ncbi:NACHT domain-containing protein [Streptomyces sp. TE12347]
MASRWRTRPVIALICWIVLCLGGLAWTVFALMQVKLQDADTAGVLAVLPGLLGAAFGGWGVRLAVRALRGQRTPDVLAAELAPLVLRSEGQQYRQLLGSGRAAPAGRIDLAFTAHISGASGGVTTGSLESITSYYRQLKPGRVVITGTPATTPASGSAANDAGVGKTVLALALLLGLLRERKNGDPVPVRLNASSWPGSSIRKWLTSHIVTTYGFDHREASLLVEADLILPIIDGLDEMDRQENVGYKSRAAHLLRTLEEFESGGTHSPAILTCRQAQYQELVEVDAHPRHVTHITIPPVDPSRARNYLEQRVANTPLSRQRWQTILDALELVSAGDTSVRAEHVTLARALDTPWRLTLAAIVFQERSQDGTYLRHPDALLELATRGTLYEYLLDRFIGAAIASPPTEDSLAFYDPTIDQGSFLDGQSTWRHLAALAHYLRSNDAPGGARTVARRPLSSTDITLHELWPMGGTRLPKALERTVAAIFATIVALIIFKYPHTPVKNPTWIHLSVAATAILFFTFVEAGRSWPTPQHIDLQWFRLRARRRQLAREAAIMLATLETVSILYGIFAGLQGDNFWGDFKKAASFGLVAGAALTAFKTLTEKVFSNKARTAGSPRQIIREDSLTLGAHGALAGSIACFFCAAGDASAAAIPVCVAFGLATGFMMGAGRASLRYFAFLSCTRNKLPWRLGRFLDEAYELGILRASGTVWQFRHRELQDHLATRPIPPSQNP